MTRTNRTPWWPLAASALIMGLVGACGGGGSPTSPSATGSGGGTSGTPVETTTLTITASGISPKLIHIAVGQSVTVINNDSLPHAPSSDPHPTHTECPPMNELGDIPAGATRQTGAFTTARTCGFHDHDQPGNAALKGQILIQ
jgi:hypothetical protein